MLVCAVAAASKSFKKVWCVAKPPGGLLDELTVLGGRPVGTLVHDCTTYVPLSCQGYNWRFKPGCGTCRVFMQKVPTLADLHVVQFSAELQMHSGLHPEIL